MMLISFQSGINDLYDYHVSYWVHNILSCTYTFGFYWEEHKYTGIIWRSKKLSPEHKFFNIGGFSKSLYSDLKLLTAHHSYVFTKCLTRRLICNGTLNLIFL